VPLMYKKIIYLVGAVLMIVSMTFGLVAHRLHRHKAKRTTIAKVGNDMTRSTGDSHKNKSDSRKKPGRSRPKGVPKGAFLVSENDPEFMAWADCKPAFIRTVGPLYKPVEDFYCTVFEKTGRLYQQGNFKAVQGKKLLKINLSPLIRAYDVDIDYNWERMSFKSRSKRKPSFEIRPYGTHNFPNGFNKDRSKKRIRFPVK